MIARNRPRLFSEFFKKISGAADGRRWWRGGAKSIDLTVQGTPGVRTRLREASKRDRSGLHRTETELTKSHEIDLDFFQIFSGAAGGRRWWRGGAKSIDLTVQGTPGVRTRSREASKRDRSGLDRTEALQHYFFFFTTQNKF